MANTHCSWKGTFSVTHTCNNITKCTFWNQEKVLIQKQGISWTSALNIYDFRVCPQHYEQCALNGMILLKCCTLCATKAVSSMANASPACAVMETHYDYVQMWVRKRFPLPCRWENSLSALWNYAKMQQKKERNWLFSKWLWRCWERNEAICDGS